MPNMVEHDGARWIVNTVLLTTNDEWLERYIDPAQRLDLYGDGRGLLKFLHPETRWVEAWKGQLYEWVDCNDRAPYYGVVCLWSLDDE